MQQSPTWYRCKWCKLANKTWSTRSSPLGLRIPHTRCLTVVDNQLYLSQSMYLGHVQLSPASRGTATKGKYVCMQLPTRTAKAVRLTTCGVYATHTTSRSVQWAVRSVNHYTQSKLLKGEATEGPIVLPYACVSLEPNIDVWKSMLAVSHYLYQFQPQHDI